MQKPAEASWVYQAVDETTTEFASSIKCGEMTPAASAPAATESIRRLLCRNLFQTGLAL
jgi:hypothetical protein